MSGFNRRRSGKVAVMLLSALFSGNDSQAKETKSFNNKNLTVQSSGVSINKNSGAKSPQSLGRTQVTTPITQRKFFKPLVIAASALVVATAAGFTIWGLVRNKKKDEKPDDKDALKNDVDLDITAESIINLKNNLNVKGDGRSFTEENINESMIFKEKIENSDAGNEEIKKHNLKVIDDALNDAVNLNNMERDVMKKAIYAVFEEAANNPKLVNKNLNRLKMIGKNKIKINGFYVKYDHSIGNYVQLFFDNKESYGYEIFWRSDNVAVANYIVWSNSNGNYKLVTAMMFNNFPYPFEVPKQEEEEEQEQEQEGE